ncbi:MAG: protein kinase [Lachnospiraceae bacterium]|nr:protein kinase [Lachnospiraceae bacterium]
MNTMATTDMSLLCPDCFSFQYAGGRCQKCGYVQTDIQEGGRTLAPGVLLGNRYLMGRVLGIGGFGITYKAFDNLYHEVCAIKEFAPSGMTWRRPGDTVLCLSSPSEKEHFEHGKKRFMDEAQTLKRLQNIPEVVQVKECFQENQTAYFSMEFLDGTSLKRVIRATGGNVAWKDVTDIIARIGTALDIIHRTTGILHRDISPENICLKQDGAVKLIDFGSARQLTRDERCDFSVEYKHGFAPPEQYTRNGSQGPHTDVYALASTCYYAMTGVMIPDAMDRLGNKTYTPLSRLRPDVPEEISQALDRALALDYRERTRSAAEFVQGITPGTVAAASGSHLKEKKSRPFLEITGGTYAGVRWNLPANTHVTIGRSVKVSNIVIPGDRSISKEHCRLYYDENKNEFLLTDVSRNGVYVQSRRLTPNQVYHYTPSQQIGLAGAVCTITLGVAYE